MTCSQSLYNVDKKLWSDDITVKGIPKGYWAGVTGSAIAAGSSTRQVVVMIMEGGGWAEGGTNNISTGIYERQDGEVAVCVTVMKDGVSQCTDTQSYP